MYEGKRLSLVPLVEFGLLQQRLKDFAMEALAVYLHIFSCLLLCYFRGRLGPL